MSLVLDIDGTGIDRSKYRTNMAKVGGVILGGRPKYNGSTGYLNKTIPNWRSGDSQGTILAWIKRNSIGSRDVILSTADTAGASHRWKLQISASNILEFFAFESPSTVAQLTGTATTFAAGRCYFVAFTGNGSEYKMYVDGEPEAFNVGSGADDGSWLDSVTLRDNVVIGAEVTSSIADYFDGMVDDVKVCDEALAADWIKAYYEQSRQHRLSA